MLGLPRAYAPSNQCEPGQSKTVFLTARIKPDLLSAVLTLRASRLHAPAQIRA